MITVVYLVTIIAVPFATLRLATATPVDAADELRWHLVPLTAVEFDMYGYGDDRYCGRVDGGEVRELRAGELRRIEFVTP